MRKNSIYYCENCGKSYNYNLLKNGKPNVIFCSEKCCKEYNEKDENKKYTICKNCGKEFQTLRYMSGKYNRSQFCCNKCESEYNLKQNQYIEAICRNCGKTFRRERLESGKFSKSEFCSNSCAKEYRQTIPYGYDKCIVCGKIFKEELMVSGNTKYKQNKFCSENCKNVYNKEKYGKIKTKICKQCGKEFELKNDKTHDNRMFCSEDCIRQYEREKSIKNNIKICKFCGKTFIPDYTKSGRISATNFCSDSCWLSYWQHMNIEKHGVPYTFMLNNKHIVVSKRNQQFAKLLQDNNIEFSYEYEIIKDDKGYAYSYDFYLPNYNLLIEINPTFTHSAVENSLGWTGKDKNYHYNKMKTANENGYKCICIWDWDSKEDIIKAILNNILQIQKHDIVKHWSIPESKQHIIDDNFDEQEMLDKGYKPVYDDGQTLIY